MRTLGTVVVIVCAAAVAMIVMSVLSPVTAMAAPTPEWRASGLDMLGAQPGEFVTYVINIANDFGQPRSFEWALRLPMDWVALGAVGRVELEAESDTPVFVTFFAPGSAAAGEYPISVSVTNADTGQALEWEVKAHVPMRRGIGLEQAAMPAAYPGEALDYKFIVHNRGNTSEIVEVAVTAPTGWYVHDYERVRKLDAGARVVVTVPVTVGRNAQPGTLGAVQADVSAVRTDVRSQAGPQDETLAETLSLNATIRPPHPELVPALRPDTLPATVWLSTGSLGHREGPSPTLAMMARGRVGANDTDISLLAGASHDLDEGVFVNRVEAKFSRDPYSLRFGLWRNRAPQPVRHSVTFTYDEAHRWLSAGAVSLGLSPLVSVSGRGLAVRHFESAGIDYGAFVLGDTAGFTLGRDGGRSKARITLMDKGPGRPLWSVSGHAFVTNEVTLEGEAVGMGEHTAWYVGFGLNRARWRMSTRYFSYGAAAVRTAGAGQSGFEFNVSGTLITIPVRLSASDSRTNVLGDPALPVEAVSRAALSTSLPVRGAALRASLQWDRRHTLVTPLGDPERERATLAGELTWQRRRNDRYWIVRAAAEQRHERIANVHDAAFSVGPGTGWSSPTVRTEVGVVWHGAGDTLQEARELASFGPALSVNWRPRVRHKPDLRMDYYGGVRPRLHVRGSLELADSIDLTASATARYRDTHLDRTYRVGLAYRFGLPVPGAYSRGAVEGQIYVVNGDAAAGVDGRLAGVVVVADGERVSTDEVGRFRFPPLRPGEYEVALENVAALGGAYESQVDLPLLVEVRAGETTEIMIPITLMARMRGRVYFESGQADDALRRSPAGIELQWRRDGDIVAHAITDSVGFYESPLLDPGHYELFLVPTSLPRRTTSTGTFPLTITLEPGRSIRYDIGLKEIGLPIRIDVDL